MRLFRSSKWLLKVSAQRSTVRYAREDDSVVRRIATQQAKTQAVRVGAGPRDDWRDRDDLSAVQLDSCAT
ncbi:hypothetical protein GCM10011410_17520 [Hoyosella rhizosphaerae]|uniref:Uncharacterized protein n=1 Tax=Hoyosella rhizosphaerae TaxID=1755582 RepID=A0A916XE91_9ACTN|nr:hypothetical protein GCM10011410_17520 [Hoyosella rhizosphaerae]